jgi:acetyl-CoA acyltransferase
LLYGSFSSSGGPGFAVGSGLAVAQRYPGGLIQKGISAELIARRWGLSRAELDEFAATSHQRAAEAWKQGRFAGQVAPLAGLETDETIRPGTTVGTLAGLRPAFADERWAQRFGALEWKVTAGNSIGAGGRGPGCTRPPRSATIRSCC